MDEDHRYGVPEKAESFFGAKMRIHLSPPPDNSGSFRKKLQQRTLKKHIKDGLTNSKQKSISLNG
jgi:hypothetical protein